MRLADERAFPDERCLFPDEGCLFLMEGACAEECLARARHAEASVEAPTVQVS